jgi:hypothetical protein
MRQHASNDFLLTDSRRESATHHSVKPNSFFLLSRLWAKITPEAAGVRRYPMLQLFQLIERSRQIAEDLGAHAPDKVKATLRALFCRVEIRSDRVDITLSRDRLTQLLAGSIDLKMQHQAPTSAPDELLGLTVPVSLKRVGREMRMLVENANDQTAADPLLAQDHCSRPPRPGASEPKPQANHA